MSANMASVIGKWFNMTSQTLIIQFTPGLIGFKQTCCICNARPLKKKVAYVFTPVRKTTLWPTNGGFGGKIKFLIKM